MGGFRTGPSSGGGNNNKTKFGYTKPKSTIQKVGDYIKGGGVVGSVVRGVKSSIKKSKQNVLDYEGQAAGVTPERKPTPTINNGGGDNNNNQGIQVANQTGSLTAQTQQAAVDAAPDGPTNIEMPEESEAERLLKIKRKGRRATILNVPEEELTLSKKILLG